MAEERYWLTAADVEDLRALLAEFRGRDRTGTGRTAPRELGTAPDTYLALAPAGGIPALTPGTTRLDDVPGKADCDVWRIVPGVPGTPDPALTPVSPTQVTVYNMGDQAVPEDTWVAVHRDRFGVWVVGGGAGGSPHVWVRITGKTAGTTPNTWIYTARKVDDQTWVDSPGPVDYTGIVYRAPSNIEPPFINNGQFVKLEVSKTDPTKRVITAVGSLQAATGTVGPYLSDVSVSNVASCSSGVVTVTSTVTKTYKTQTLTVTARDCTVGLPAPS